METCSSFCIWPLLSGLDRSVHKSARSFATLDKGENAIVVTNEKEVYSIGINGDNGPLGIGTTEPAITCTRIKSLSGKEIKNIIGCEGPEGRVVLLTKDYQIYSWGSNSSKALGYITDLPNVLVPVQIPFGQVKFIKVAIGGKHTAAITYDYKAYAWGDNAYGQLGTGDQDSSATPVPSGISEDGELDEHAMVKDIACGISNTYYLAQAQDGKGFQVYSVGSGEYGALGTGKEDLSADACALTLEHIDMENTNFKSVYAGAHCGYAITDYNRAIAWGQNDMCQLGVMGDIYMSVPVVIGSFHLIAAHCDSNMAGGMSKATVFVWGDTRFGVLKTQQKTPLNNAEDIFVVYNYSHTSRLVELISSVTTPGLMMIPPTTETVRKEYVIHPTSCDDDGFPVAWSSLEHNSIFFRALIDAEKITKNTKHYVLVGFDRNTVKHYVDYLNTGTIDSGISREELLKLIELCIAYREMGLLQYITSKFGVYPNVHKEKLTVENVCIIYEKALKDKDDVTKELCIEFILQHMLPVFMSAPFLTGIKCETMRSIMQELASRYEGMFAQIAKGRKGGDGEGIIVTYPKSIVNPVDKGDVDSFVYNLATTHYTDPIDDIMTYIKKRSTEEEESKAVYKCITLPRVDTISSLY